MNWEDYSKNFTEAYLKEGYTIEKIKVYLGYSKKLFDQDLPIIIDTKHLSYLLGYDITFLYGISNSPRVYYRSFKLKKKNGKYRNINEPLPNLKEIQNWIDKSILKKVQKYNPYIKSYKENMSIKDNARYHRNQENVLTIDIKDYFPNIKVEDVVYFFRKLGYSSSVSVLLAKICCLDDSLPQGAPTSPLLSNLVTSNIDIRISQYCKKNKIRYTRYADDLTFSGKFKVKSVINFTKKVLKENKFEINYKKIRNQKKHEKQVVTGITVNKKMQADLKLRKKLRQEVYFINKYGLDSHLEEIGEERIYVYRLIGLINFTLFVNPKNEEMKKTKETLYQYLIKNNILKQKEL